VPGEKELTGFGVSYCATCDAPFYRDKEIVVVGGGNSAVQESLHLAKFARSITILQLLDQLTATKLLQEKLEAEPKISVRYKSELREIYGAKRVEGVKYQDHTAGATVDLPCGGVFVFIGLTPNTDFLKGTIDLDEQGFVVTPPGSLETSMSGVFAAGDVRAGSTKQIASAAGEGTVASFLAKAYAEAHAGTRN
jgi:thioredoxin reductase (NADPH)